MGRLDDLAKQWEAGGIRLTDIEEAEVLSIGPTCPGAKWVEKPSGAREIQCPLYGPDTQLWQNPNGNTCRHCQQSADYNPIHDDHNEYSLEHRRMFGAAMGRNLGQARAHVVVKMREWRVDPANANWQHMLTHAIAEAPGLSDNDKVVLARERGLVE